jgi:hypothetical protein
MIATWSTSIVPHDLTGRPLKNNWGWVISISPKGLDEDWTYPVTFPIRTGEQQVMGTGYGRTVQQKMKPQLSVNSCSRPLTSSIPISVVSPTEGLMPITTLMAQNDALYQSPNTFMQATSRRSYSL